jgi:hypothetical protein
VIATKISTRERIVQAWVHTRIIQYYMEKNGLKPHRSLIVVVSETQRLKKKIQDTCIPRQVALYQKYVAAVDGVYYLDPPPAYTKLAEKKHVNIKTVAELLSTDLPTFLAEKINQEAANPAP